MIRPVHKATFCDGCKTQVITGKRYKCGNCIDYNLCGICIDYEKHNQDHAFIVLHRPLGENLEKTKLLSKRLFTTTSDFGLSFGHISPSFFGTIDSEEAPLTEHKKGPLFDSIVNNREPRPNPFQSVLLHPFGEASKFSF